VQAAQVPVEAQRYLVLRDRKRRGGERDALQGERRDPCDIHFDPPVIF
jgi:hypothetical protein